MEIFDRFTGEHAGKDVAVTWIRIEDDPNLADSFFAVGRGADGRFVVAWGRDCDCGELPATDIEDGACGHEWHATEAEAVAYLESILEAARSV